MKTQYIVQGHGYIERSMFYNYIHNRYKIKDINYTKEEMCQSTFPFIVDLKKKKLYILESITCCAIASQNNKIIKIEEFKEGV